MGSVLIGSIRGPRGDPGPKGEPGIQGVPGPLPPLVNNYLPVQEGTAAADAAVLHDIDSRIENTKDSLSKVALSGRAPDVETDEDHRFVTDDEKNEWNGKVDASGGDISETVVGTLDNITESFPVPAAGEKPRTFLGKVRKNLQDWKNLKDTLLTLNRLVNNGQTTASGYALDARYGKTLYDLYAQLNSNFTQSVKYTSGKATINTTFVSPVSTTYVRWNRTGRIVVVELYDVDLKEGYSTDSVAIIATGLPKSRTGAATSIPGWIHPDGRVVQMRLNLDSNGTLRPWYMGTSVWTSISGSFAYTVAD